jgi:SAM-dependent methyltransferase
VGGPETGHALTVSRSVHDAAERGFAAAAEVYERSRPDYPSEAIDRLIQELELTRSCRAMDLGAGTGKLTRLLLPAGVSLVAVEPVEAMRAAFASVLPDVRLVGGVAEAIRFADGSFDAVVCAQAFHWFDGDRALTAIHRALKRWGRLGLLWNVRDESVPWVRELTEIIHPYERTAPREKTHDWRRAFSASDLFGRLNQLRFPHAQWLDRDGLVERFASVSFIASLSPGERESVLGRIRALAETHPDLAGRDDFDLPYVTELYWCNRV